MNHFSLKKRISFEVTVAAIHAISSNVIISMWAGAFCILLCGWRSFTAAMQMGEVVERNCVSL